MSPPWEPFGRRGVERVRGWPRAVDMALMWLSFFALACGALSRIVPRLSQPLDPGYRVDETPCVPKCE